MREISNSTITSGIIEKNNNQWPSSTLVSGLYYLHIEAVPGTCIGIGFGNNSSTLRVGQTGILELSFDENSLPDSFSVISSIGSIVYYTYISVIFVN